MKKQSKIVAGAGALFILLILSIQMGFIFPASTLVYEDFEDGVLPVFEMPEGRATLEIDTTGKLEGQKCAVFENIPNGAGTPILNYHYPTGLTVDEWEITIMIDETHQENLQVSLFQNVEYTYEGELHSTWGFTIGLSFYIDTHVIKAYGGDFPAFDMHWQANVPYTIVVNNIDYENETGDVTITDGVNTETKSNLFFRTNDDTRGGTQAVDTSHKIDGWCIHGSTWHTFKVYFDKFTIGYQDQQQIVDQPEGGTEPTPVKQQEDNVPLFLIGGIAFFCVVFYITNKKEK